MQKFLFFAPLLIVLTFTACEDDPSCLDCTSSLSAYQDSCLTNVETLIPQIRVSYEISEECEAYHLCYRKLPSGEEVCLEQLMKGGPQEVVISDIEARAVYQFVLETHGSVQTDLVFVESCSEEEPGDSFGSFCSNSLRLQNGECMADSAGNLNPSILLKYRVSEGCGVVKLCYTNSVNTDEACLENLVYGSEQEVVLKNLLPNAQYKFVLSNAQVRATGSINTNSCN